MLLHGRRFDLRPWDTTWKMKRKQMYREPSYELPPLCTIAGTLPWDPVFMADYSTLYQVS